MISLLIGLIGIIITILLIVGIHEFGHFLFAKMLGVKVLRFSIGFGKTLFRTVGKTGTEYVIAAIPLGGYVKLVDEHEQPVAKEDLPFEFNQQPIYKRFLIVIAGPLFNFIFAFFIYWFLFLIGFTTLTPIIGSIEPHSIAEQAGLKPQQEIIAIQQEPTLSWFSIIIKLISSVGSTNHISITTQIPNQPIQSHELNLTHWKLDNLKPDPLSSLGIIPYEPTVAPIIAEIEKDSPAKNQLKIGDKILFINHKPIKDWSDVTSTVSDHPDELLNFTIERQQKIINLPIKTTSENNLFFNKRGLLKVSAEWNIPKNLLRQNQFGPLAAIPHAWYEVRDLTFLNILIFEKLLTGKMSITSLGGPITIFESAGSAINNGLTPFLSFLAFLSIGIGFINVIPIPGLDGGHILFQAIELITRRPLSLRFKVLFYKLGFILLLMLIIQAVMNDLMRMW